MDEKDDGKVPYVNSSVIDSTLPKHRMRGSHHWVPLGPDGDFDGLSLNFRLVKLSINNTISIIV